MKYTKNTCIRQSKTLKQHVNALEMYLLSGLEPELLEPEPHRVPAPALAPAPPKYF
jgi:hypothetical protein